MPTTFRDTVRAHLDALKKAPRTSCLADVTAMTLLVATLLVAVTTREHAQARELLARLVALGMLVAEYPEIERTTPFDEPTWTRDTWSAQIQAITAKTTPEEVARTWLRHKHLFAGTETFRAWGTMRYRCDVAQIDMTAVEKSIDGHDPMRTSR